MPRALTKSAATRGSYYPPRSPPQPAPRQSRRPHPLEPPHPSLAVCDPLSLRSPPQFPAHVAARPAWAIVFELSVDQPDPDAGDAERLGDGELLDVVAHQAAEP